MTSKRLSQVKIYLLAIDMIMLNLALYLAPVLMHGWGIGLAGTYKYQVVFLNLLWVLTIHSGKLYEAFQYRESMIFIQGTLNACITYFLFAGGVVLLVSLRHSPSPDRLLLFLLVTVLFVCFLLVERMIVLGLRKKIREKGPQRNVVLLGPQPMRERVYASIREHSLVYDVVGTFSLAEEGAEDNVVRHQYKGGFDSFLNFLSLHKVHEIYCEYGAVPHHQLQQISSEADRRMIRLRFLFNRPGVVGKDIRFISGLGEFPVLTFRPEPLQGGFNQFLKRSMDILFSLAVIIGVMSWLTPLLAILIKLDSKGPVFFKQLRSGKNNQPFLCYKFRSMRVNDLADTTQATLNDDRFTRIGRFLRRTSLDELPQFFNVLLNDMSVVGPRPHMLAHTEKYKRLLDNYMVRHFVKPGITGWAQVSGFRGETKKLSEMEQRVQHDVHYLENWSFGLDLKIIFLTTWLLLKKEEKAY